MEYNFSEQELIDIQNKYSLDIIWLLAEDCLKLREELASYKKARLHEDVDILSKCAYLTGRAEQHVCK